LGCVRSEAPKREVINEQIRLQDAKNTQVLDMAHQNALSISTETIQFQQSDAKFVSKFTLICSFRGSKERSYQRTDSLTGREEHSSS
jgi:hypothetical protein